MYVANAPWHSLAGSDIVLVIMYVKKLLDSVQVKLSSLPMLGCTLMDSYLGGCKELLALGVPCHCTHGHCLQGGAADQAGGGLSI